MTKINSEIIQMIRPSNEFRWHVLNKSQRQLKGKLRMDKPETQTTFVPRHTTTTTTKNNAEK